MIQPFAKEHCRLYSHQIPKNMHYLHENCRWKSKLEHVYNVSQLNKNFKDFRGRKDLWISLFDYLQHSDGFQIKFLLFAFENHQKYTRKKS